MYIDPCKVLHSPLPYPTSQIQKRKEVWLLLKTYGRWQWLVADVAAASGQPRSKPRAAPVYETLKPPFATLYPFSWIAVSVPAAYNIVDWHQHSASQHSRPTVPPRAAILEQTIICAGAGRWVGGLDEPGAGRGYLLSENVLSHFDIFISTYGGEHCATSCHLRAIPSHGMVSIGSPSLGWERGNEFPNCACGYQALIRPERSSTWPTALLAR